MRITVKLAFLFILLSIIWPLQIQASSTREMVLQILKDYSPNGYTIVDQFQKAQDEVNASSRVTPKCDFMIFVKGETEREIIESLGTMVHEICHEYCRIVSYKLCKERYKKLSLGRMYDAYYIGSETTTLVKKTAVFNTREIAASIPEEFRNNNFIPYITTDPQCTSPGTVNTTKLPPEVLAVINNLGSQIEGVYGLLNEYNAYYYKTCTNLDLYSYYRDRLEFNVDTWVTFINKVDNCHFIHLEFKLFILKYLQYAKAHYSKIYKEIMKNQDFIKTFLAIDQNYSQVVTVYYQRKNEIYERLRQEGYTVTEDEDYFYIKGQSVNKQVLHFRKTYNNLHLELAKDEYQFIMEELQQRMK